nr:MAG TPA: tail protein [Caudoviricetes sp.]
MRGDRFKRRLPKYIGNISDMDDTFYAEDKEFDLVDRLIDDFDNSQSLQSILDTSDPEYYLRRLEDDYGLDHKGELRDRVARILLKMKAKRTTTEEVVLEICQSLGFPAKYEEYYREYSFLLELYVNGELDMEKLLDTLMEVTPAHLLINMNLNFARDLALQTRSGNDSYLMYLCGEHPCGDIPYPWAVGKVFSTEASIKTSKFDSNNYYPLAGDGYRANEPGRGNVDIGGGKDVKPRANN